MSYTPPTGRNLPSVIRPASTLPPYRGSIAMGGTPPSIPGGGANSKYSSIVKDIDLTGVKRLTVENYFMKPLSVQRLGGAAIINPMERRSFDVIGTNKTTISSIGTIVGLTYDIRQCPYYTDSPYENADGDLFPTPPFMQGDQVIYSNLTLLPQPMVSGAPVMNQSTLPGQFVVLGAMFNLNSGPSGFGSGGIVVSGMIQTGNTTGVDIGLLASFVSLGSYYIRVPGYAGLFVDDNAVVPTVTGDYIIFYGVIPNL